MNLEQLFQAQKQQSWQWRKAPLQERKELLQKLFEKIRSLEPEICEALRVDFGKPELESIMTEIYPTLQEIRHCLKNLEKWAKPKKVSTPLMLAGTHSEIRSEPKGCVLIIAPWNYPFQLAMLPLVSAIAAGNCVILKPSELTHRTSRLLEEIISDIFPANHVAVVQGGKEVSQKLLQLPFDHIFFTGSTQVGKIVMEAASRHLSDITLELGGKSPTIIDESADLNLAAEKIVWGKFVNAGQTCVAPDYLLVQNEVHSELMEKIKAKIQKMYQDADKDLAGVISSAHLQRLSGLFNEALAEKAQLIGGGQFDFQKNRMTPTVLDLVSTDSKIMNEEIFGPLLPVLTFNSLSEAIDFINERPKPLALYIFSREKTNIEWILKETSAGGVTINDTLLHFANHNLPFGGVGASGLGRYHGHFGFQTFSHQKAVLRQSWMGRFFRVLYPPYSDWKLRLVKRINSWGI